MNATNVYEPSPLDVILNAGSERRIILIQKALIRGISMYRTHNEKLQRFIQELSSCWNITSRYFILQTVKLHSSFKKLAFRHHFNSFFLFWQSTTTFLLVIFRPKSKRKRWKRHFSHLGTFREFIIIKFVWPSKWTSSINFRDCRVVRDPQTLKSKGYGFVSFVKKTVSKPFYVLVLILSYSLFSDDSCHINLLKGWHEKSPRLRNNFRRNSASDFLQCNQSVMFVSQRKNRSIPGKFCFPILLKFKFYINKTEYARKVERNLFTLSCLHNIRKQVSFDFFRKSDWQIEHEEPIFSEFSIMKTVDTVDG